jgi:hypothetical protein
MGGAVAVDATGDLPLLACVIIVALPPQPVRISNRATLATKVDKTERDLGEKQRMILISPLAYVVRRCPEAT